MKDLYIVTHQTGTGGAFLNTLIYSWITNEDLSKFEFDEYGSAHGDLESITFSNHMNGSRHPVTGEHSSMIPFWPWIKAKEHNKPLCVRSHCLVDDTIHNYYSNYHHFHILTTPADYEIMAFNTLIKQRQLDLQDEKEAKRQISEIVNIRLDGFANHAEKDKHWVEPYDQPNTTNILFNDIMKNPSKVYSQLVEVLGSMPDHIPVYHSRYILKNKQTTEKYAPWITYYT